jgi:hypothetical protein
METWREMTPEAGLNGHRDTTPGRLEQHSSHPVALQLVVTASRYGTKELRAVLTTLIHYNSRHPHATWGLAELAHPISGLEAQIQLQPLRITPHCPLERPEAAVGCIQA